MSSNAKSARCTPKTSRLENMKRPQHLRRPTGRAASAARCPRYADAGSAPIRRLPQRPSYEALAVLDWNVSGRFDLRAELRAIGKAIDLDAAGQWVDLPAAAEIALRAAVPIARMGAHDLMLTLAVDNLTDAQIFPQAGLPSPGRVWRIGLRFD